MISSNRSPKRQPKNWRVFEKSSLERYFGHVLDVNGEDGVSVERAFHKHRDTIEFIRWYPDPELLNREEYDGMVMQSERIGDIPYITSSATGFINVQSKERAFEKWKKANIYCPDYFTFDSRDNLDDKLSETSFSPPFLLRLNNSVSGYDSFLIQELKDIDEYWPQLDVAFKHAEEKHIGIDTQKICVALIDTIDKERNLNHSFRIHVSGNRVISGYARVASQDDWIVITKKFTADAADDWLYYNVLCERLCNEYEDEICRAVHVLDLNYQGVDAVIDQSNGKLCFLEVQPTYASGYPFNFRRGWRGYKRPFYNPYQPELVNFLIKERSCLEPQIPRYYSNWLDKKNHFDLCYRSLREYL